METNAGTKITKNYSCENCHFKCCKKSYWERHIITAKHIKLTKINDNVTPFQKELIIYSCNICNKVYKSRVGLWKHSKLCKEVEVEVEVKVYENNSNQIVMTPDIAFFTNLVLEVTKNNAELQKQNQEFQKQMMELYKTTSTTNIQHNNSHNKTFNMQVFLNEKCKDAMNIMDFVNSMTLELSDLEDVGELGYVEGISKIMIRKLNELDVYKRPIHCSDAKREIMFVRDENVWSKENSTYDKIRKAIKHVSHKNSCLLGPWSQAYPDCMNNQHRLNDVYVKMIGQAMGGRAEFVDSENKIMKKIAKAVLIEKY
jgi:hypothetical protein